MKKKYIAPATMVVNVKTEGIMKEGVSFYNYGKGKESEGKDVAGENNNPNIEVDAKGNSGWDNVWED